MSTRRIFRMQIIAFLIPVCVVLVIVIAHLTREKDVALSQSAHADRVVIEKHSHTMTLLADGRPLKTYHVALGRGGLGSKYQAGENKVPEGEYRIASRNSNSAFHLALRIGYPTVDQTQRARQLGIDPGGDIMIHGIRNGLGWLGLAHRSVDWTKGCVAVTDKEIEEIWRVVSDGTPVEIRP